MSISIGQSNTFFDGWAPYSGTVTYSSATRISVPTDATLRHEIGEFARFKQGGGFKYFVVYGKAATTLDLFGGTDYTVANAAITDLAFSKFNTAVGLPAAWNYAPAITGFSANPTNSVYRADTKGRIMHMHVNQQTAGTSNGTGLTIAAPVQAATIANAIWGSLFYNAQDNGVNLTSPGRCFIASAGTVVTIDRDLAGAAWTNINGKRVTFDIWYEF